MADLPCLVCDALKRGVLPAIETEGRVVVEGVFMAGFYVGRNFASTFDEGRGLCDRHAFVWQAAESARDIQRAADAAARS